MVCLVSYLHSKGLQTNGSLLAGGSLQVVGSCIALAQEAKRGGRRLAGNRD